MFPSWSFPGVSDSRYTAHQSREDASGGGWRGVSSDARRFARKVGKGQRRSARVMMIDRKRAELTFFHWPVVSISTYSQKSRCWGWLAVGRGCVGGGEEAKSRTGGHRRRYKSQRLSCLRQNPIGLLPLRGLSVRQVLGEEDLGEERSCARGGGPQKLYGGETTMRVFSCLGPCRG